MGGLSIIASTIIAIIELLIFLSPFMLGWIGYSYIFSKLIYSFSKRYLNINISFSRTLAITSLSGISSFIIDIIFFIIRIILFIFYNPFYNPISILYSISIVDFISYIAMLSVIIILSVILGIPTVFIASLIAYKYLPNVNLRKAIVMSFATLLAWLTFIIIVIIVGYITQYLYNILFPPSPVACCTLHYIE